MGANTSVVRIPTSLDGDFFRYYLEFLTPIHKLSPREMDVFAAFLKQRYLLSKVIFDDKILARVLMSEDTKRAVMEALSLSQAHFQVIYSKLRRLRYIVDGVVDKRFLPDVDESQDRFNLIFYFDLNGRVSGN